MRIIDQNGCDYPYESIVISHTDGMVIARPVSNIDKRYLLAEYSTQEKAGKAMQKLRECYEEAKRFEAFGNVSVDNMISWYGRGETMNKLSEDIFLFVFPREDEI